MEHGIHSAESFASGIAGVPAPVVSVAITAFNSEKWIARALDSALAQKTRFPVEIIVSDDFSQDGTVAIARSYEQAHPEIVRVLERPANVGIQRNYYETFRNCRGKYIAWLDADDYWTDPDKLNIQVELLNSDPSISMSCHFVRWITPDGTIKRERFPYAISAGRYGVEDILKTCFVPSVSVLFRNGIQDKLPDWYFDIAPVTDWPIWVLAAQAGDIVLLDRIMADYFHTPGSASTSKGSMFLYNLEAGFYEKVESIIPSRLHRMVRAEKGKRYEMISYWIRKQQGDFSTSRKAAVKAFVSPFFIDNFWSKSKTLFAAFVREMEWRIRGGRTAG